MKTFEKLLAFGEEGEHEVAKELIKKGASVMPLYQFENKHAPYILTLESKVTSPDLICFSKKAFMVEVKTKNQWVEHKGLVETGLNYRLFKQYKKVKDSTNYDVFVFFNHKTENPQGIYYCKLEQNTRYWDGCVKGKKVYDAMMFYDQKILKKLEGID